MSGVKRLRPLPLSDRALEAPPSGIVAVVDHARGRQGLIPLWVGEGDQPTPDFIARPACEALLAGETFYTWQQGIPELRAALGRYFLRHFGVEAGPDRFIVTGSGMQAIKLAIQAVVDPGDECIYLSPAWPNFAAALEIGGGSAVPVPLDFAETGWRLDVSRIESAITPRTRALFINTPSNPTGWAADRPALEALIDVARRHDLWIIADEIYALYWYGEGPRAPSFLDVSRPDDRILYVNTFSKNWAMTGWRVGWIMANPALMPIFENLVQYSTSGVPQFLQRGCTAALDEGDAHVAGQRERAERALGILADRLAPASRVRFAPPQGAFYLFFAVDGVSDTLTAAKKIVDRTGVGLAPGSAFGAGGEGFFRLCFNRDLRQIERAADRLAIEFG
ncbi:pyridoxal phosphate-dependent aminotransferase [Oricola cellulosilytica]|uniref:aspartate transaminase n=1 Tax=Oricola cellulosilytica TaxID=1429082 RepID=A0A4R0PDF7_9HYPH|nr:pyridoxal phosphate-dependent aminotransferase [Oricola cellulosilytica]TCD14369.1 pyridoxal phosphate-dependent aminotransferase [Oricola cellulosilytica]